MKNILVAIETNNSKLTSRMISEAAKLALAFDSKCWLIQIVAPDPDFVGFEVGPQYIRDLTAEQLKASHRALQEQTNILKAMGVKAEGLTIQGPTEEMIRKEVDKLAIDLLILGNKNHGLLHSIFVGSITDDLIKEVHIPIYLVPEEAE